MTNTVAFEGSSLANPGTDFLWKKPGGFKLIYSSENWIRLNYSADLK